MEWELLDLAEWEWNISGAHAKDGWMEAWMDGWREGGTGGWKDGGTEG